jgi:hypothetical protein
MTDVVDWSKLAIICDKHNLADAINMASSMKEDEWLERTQYAKWAYNTYFTQHGVCEYIKMKLEQGI